MNAYHKHRFSLITDALDLFDTKLVMSFTKLEIVEIMGKYGLTEIQFCRHTPFDYAFDLKK